MRRLTPLAGVLLIVVGAVLLITSWPTSSKDEPIVAVVPTASATPTGIAPTTTPTAAVPTTVTPAESPQPLPTPAGQDIERLLMPALNIDAPIIVLGVDPDGAMQSPNNPTDVAWYRFSARPGQRSNIVMAGHLDYVNYGAAVFYRLREAKPGDEVHLVLVDGSVARYRVLNQTTYDEATAPVQEIVGPTDAEVLTLITCAGSFDPRSREYDKRIVVRAERIQDVATQGS